jgi:cardiolipin-specific phospholipase
MVPNNPSSPTPRPIPRGLWAVVAYLWQHDFTPGSLMRYFGPLGPWLARAGVRRRAERWVLQRPIAAVQDDVGDYFFHNLCSDGAGEYALRHIFAPGVWAHAPIGERLVAAATAGRLTYPVTFLYGGSHDWMSAPAGDAVCKQLRALGFRAECHRIPMSGHHLYLENPDAFNSAVRGEVEATLEAAAEAEAAASQGDDGVPATKGKRGKSEAGEEGPAGDAADGVRERRPAGGLATDEVAVAAS